MWWSQINVRKIWRKSEQDKGKRQKGGWGPSINFIYKRPDRLLHRYNLIWLLAEGIIDNPVQANIVDDGIGDEVEIINKLLKVLPCRATLGEDRLALPVVRPRHGRHYGDSPGGILMRSVAGDLRDTGGDVPQTHGDGAPPSIDRVYGDSGSVEEALDLRLLVWKKMDLE